MASHPQDDLTHAFSAVRCLLLATGAVQAWIRATLICRRIKNLRAVQLLLGHSKPESTVRYLGIEVDDAVEISEQTGAIGVEDEWFIPYYIDVGTGQSDLAWQAIAGFSHSLTWGEILAAWRYLDYNFKCGSAIDPLDFNGPAIGVGFRW